MDRDREREGLREREGDRRRRSGDRWQVGIKAHH